MMKTLSIDAKNFSIDAKNFGINAKNFSIDDDGLRHRQYANLR